MSIGLIAAGYIAAAQPAQAPVPAPMQPVTAQAGSSAGQSVTSYPPSFFAATLPNTAMDMIGLVPGFAFDGGDGSRGLGGVGDVLIDGRRPASKDDSLSAVLSRIPATAVLRIDLIRGGAPGIDMQGKPVVINVIRRQDDGVKVTAIVASDFLPDGRIKPDVELQTVQRSGGTEIDGSLQLANGFDNGGEAGPYRQTGGTGAILLAGPETDRTDGMLDKATGAIETDVFGGRLRANVSVQSNPYTSTRDDQLTTPPSVEFEHDNQTNLSGEFGLHYDHPLGDKASLETYALQRLGSPDLLALYTAPGDDESYALNQRTGESVLRGDLKYNPSSRLALEAGGEGDYNWLTNRTDYTVNGALVVVPASNDDVTEKRGEVFATANWTALPTLTFDTGLRVEGSTISSTGDVVNSKTFIFAKPRLAAAWSINAKDQIRFRVEREVTQLDFSDFTGSPQFITGLVQVGNPKVTPAQDWVMEAVFDHRFWGAGEATLTLRHFALDDVVDRVPIYSPLGAYDEPGNIGPGVQNVAIVTLNLPTDKLGVSQGLITYTGTLRQSQVTDPTTGQQRAISGMHHSDQEAHFSQALPKWKARWGVDVFGGWTETYYRFDEIDRNRLGTFVSMFAEYKPNPDVTLQATLNNAASRGIRLESDIYNGARNTSGLDYVDLRDLGFNPWINLSLRKTF